ncbi:MAG: tRNA ((34)/cytosine(34)/5-carboxymethylaminomethyluridine(34)-2-O)-methyltransferase TrmL [Pseudomonadota bacterium]
MIHLVLFEPEIPPNTGNIIRLCANIGCQLHLIEPLGFALDDKRLRRAGLDYAEWKDIKIYKDWPSFLAELNPPRWFAVTTKGARSYTDVTFAPGDALVFGPESRGLPRIVLDAATPERRLRIPMRPGSRSMNLSNAASVMAYEAWRQLGFCGAQKHQDAFSPPLQSGETGDCPSHSSGA